MVLDNTATHQTRMVLDNHCKFHFILTACCMRTSLRKYLSQTERTFKKRNLHNYNTMLTDATQNSNREPMTCPCRPNGSPYPTCVGNIMPTEIQCRTTNMFSSNCTRFDQMMDKLAGNTSTAPTNSAYMLVAFQYTTPLARHELWLVAQN